MNVSLTPELEKLVQEKLASGLYTSASEVVRESLRLLEERDRVRALQHAELQKKLQVGLDELDRGLGIPAKQVMRELKARIAKAGKRRKRA